MKKKYLFPIVLFIAGTLLPVAALATFTCNFTVAEKVCVNHETKVLYTGGASANATYLWNFEDAVIISGSGQGPYYVKWETTGEKHITLSINWEGQTCTKTLPVVVVEQPQAYQMTGGGVVFPGGPGVAVGLSGSESGVVYKLMRDGAYTGIYATGPGIINFGLQTIPGTYRALAKIDGSDCMREMEGSAIVTAGFTESPHLCMISFDTASMLNRVVWNKIPELQFTKVNIFRETYQNNLFEKIGEALYNGLPFWFDSSANPLVKSDKYKVSFSDSLGNETAKSPFHKTIHLNINPGSNGFNLIWNHYEGFEFMTYRIYRRPIAGTWELIDSVASNVDSYTDLYSASGIMFYCIEVVRPEPCPQEGESSFPLSILSNTAFAAPLGTNEHPGEPVLIYPNPAREFLMVRSSGTEEYHLTICTPDGREVMSDNFFGPMTRIDLSEFGTGVYFVKYSSKSGTAVSRFIRVQ